MSKKILIGGQQAIVGDIKNVGGHFYVGLTFENGNTGSLIVSREQYNSLEKGVDDKEQDLIDNNTRMRASVKEFFRFNSGIYVPCSADSTAGIWVVEIFKHAKINVRIFTKDLPSAIFDQDEVVRQMRYALSKGIGVDIVLQSNTPESVDFINEALKGGAMIMRSTDDRVKTASLGFVLGDDKSIISHDTEEYAKVANAFVKKKAMREYLWLFEDIIHLGVELIKKDGDGNWIVYEEEGFPPPKKVRVKEVVENVVKKWKARISYTAVGFRELGGMILDATGFRKVWEYVINKRVESKANGVEEGEDQDKGR